MAGLLNATAGAKESQFNEQVSVGEIAPDFADLPGIDGKQHGLSEYKKAKAVVVVFTSNQCPVAVVYEDRLVALQKEYSKQGVQLVAICANFEAGNTLDEMKKRAEDKKFNFAYLRDNDQKTGRAYGAAKTPHVFLLNGDRKIAYMGAIDDNEKPEKVSKHYLKDAIDSVLAGKEPGTKETQQFGCNIRYKRRPPAR
jgi:peroxiredoxin